MSGWTAVTPCISYQPLSDCCTVWNTTHSGRQRASTEPGCIRSRRRPASRAPVVAPGAAPPKPSRPPLRARTPVTSAPPTGRIRRYTWVPGSDSGAKGLWSVRSYTAAFIKRPATMPLRRWSMSPSHDSGCGRPRRAQARASCLRTSSALRSECWFSSCLAHHCAEHPCSCHARHTFSRLTRSPSTTANLLLASSSAFLTPGGATHGPCGAAVSIATMVSISWEHGTDCRKDVSSALPKEGSKDREASGSPTSWVSLASWSSTPSAARASSARTMASAGGGASHSKRMMLSMPRAFNCSTMPCSSARCISGTVVSGNLA
mmetsp:Transcript_13691/g.37006  ORF Transcript_13691/g.37006 Transcript_13691/m.37006 type:complete len:319 (+) Transcript_13691:585-1541(+)